MLTCAPPPRAQDTLREIIGEPKRSNGNETSEKEARRINALRAQLNSLLREVRAASWSGRAPGAQS